MFLLVAAGPAPVTYGSRIRLTDPLTGITSQELVIRKVDKGRITPDDGGPVSQMQKIALQLADSPSRQYLSAAGPASPGVVPQSASGLSSQAGTHSLVFQAPRIREEIKNGEPVITDEVDDYLCWTIVGICAYAIARRHPQIGLTARADSLASFVSFFFFSCAAKFQYTFFDAFGQNTNVPEMPITPFPTLFTAPAYRGGTHSLELTIANFFYQDPKSQGQRALDIYLGSLGPLPCRIYKAPPPGPLTAVVGLPGPSPGQYAQEIGTDGMPRTDNNQASIFGQDYLMPPIHNIVLVDLPPMDEIIAAFKDEGPPPPQRNGGHHNGGPANGGGGGGGGAEREDARPKVLPLLFIRSYDGVGYHSGRSLRLENVFEHMRDANGNLDEAWLAAAHAAATVEGGLHGWTLRVL